MKHMKVATMANLRREEEREEVEVEVEVEEAEEKERGEDTERLIFLKRENLERRR
jgi:hypothetical protein